jgi:uncharacterized membrane protein
MSNHRIIHKRPKSSLRDNWHVLWPVWAICSILLLFGVFVLVREYRANLPLKSDIPVVALDKGRDLHLDRSELDSSQLHLFEARASGLAVKFVVQRTPDQTIHTALASCRACYRSRNRHYARQGQMMCGECNMPMNFGPQGKQPSANSCALVEIPHTETDRDITVSARDVLAQAAKQPQ